MTAVDWIIVAFVAADGAVGLRAGPDRERAVAGRASRAARSPAAGWRRCCSTRVRAHPTRRSSAWSTALMVGGLAAILFEALGEGIRRRMSFRAARRAGRHRRCGAGRHARPRVGVDRGRRRAPDARRARAAPGHPALGDPLEAERGAAAVRPAPERAGARRPVPPHPRTGGRRARPHAAHPARRRRAGSARECRAGSRSRLRPRRAGIRLGGEARNRGHQRARRGR